MAIFDLTVEKLLKRDKGSLTMKVDKQKFDSVLGKLIKADPQKRSETKAEKKPSKPSRGARKA
jgi:hypothetical protein